MRASMLRRGAVRCGVARHGERDVDASVRAPSRDARRISRPVPGDWRNADCAVRERASATAAADRPASSRRHPCAPFGTRDYRLKEALGHDRGPRNPRADGAGARAAEDSATTSMFFA
ncbi:hypothetical protein [Burkholderia oklahomensis]|uniref:hypothetical protein n=1 Tax=Burkholderia oklahomensis TaxID=342113 RepID=UPI00130EC822|nr:hypothetical protein [Burkholderia oklahomensis]